nr:hypothetical protein [Tanacetum cinerariifolium]
PGSTNPHNSDGDAVFDGKEPDFDAKKPESEVNVSPRSKFEDYSDNNINEVNAAGTLVLSVRKSSLIDASQLSDDLDIPELEDITYSDDEDDVSAEADFNNLETSITVNPIPTTRVYKDHPVTQIICDLSSATQTRSMTRVAKDQGEISQMFNDDFHTCMFACLLSHEEPKRVHQAIKDPSWIEAMQEELLQFKMQKEEVYVCLPLGFEDPDHPDKVYKVVKALYSLHQAPRACLCFLYGFMVYWMDVKSAFLYGTIEEEVYICQPPGFKDPNYPDKVYKVVKALYGLYQTLSAWYETLANYLLKNGFQRGKIYQTLFIKKQKADILLVQMYVDDIIFGSTNNKLCNAFEKLMNDKFQIGSMGELTFFLGLQVKQKNNGIFISQDKYIAKILRKFGFTDVKSASTPIETEKPLLKDPDGEDVDVHIYRSMIGSLMYLHPEQILCLMFVHA